MIGYVFKSIEKHHRKRFDRFLIHVGNIKSAVWSNLNQTEHNAKIGKKMQILNLKQLFLTNSQQPMQKKFVTTTVGHVPWGDGTAEYFYNLTNMKMARECVKSLMVGSITPYQKMRISVPKRR
ncbi:hypothetical protein BJB63x_008120 [Bartonella sp. JB63]|nr:hypothetical protein BJB15x_008230 [Bartonella sp. JB15]AQX29485.1 hypothetical protein BJB63x_008120 [Bartonella sp. JB63]